MDGVPADRERIARPDEPPELKAPELVEGSEFKSIRFADPGSHRPDSGFTAFLDGSQEMRVVGQSRGVPIVWATVSAAIRVRTNRRIVAWSERRPIVRSRYYIPRAYVSPVDSDVRDDSLFVDTTVSGMTRGIPSQHPAALMEAAVKKVQLDRVQCERELAESWCGAAKGTLYWDGSITPSEVAAQSGFVIGVIKSHRLLYADGAAFPVLVELAHGCRTSIFRVSSKTRPDVASWYVRVRAAHGRDALFGLVRIEAALGDDVASRADEISRWVMAEGAPLALPDGRWDKMAYGIRDTEEFLRAIS